MGGDHDVRVERHTAAVAEHVPCLVSPDVAQPGLQKQPLHFFGARRFFEEGAGISVRWIWVSIVWGSLALAAASAALTAGCCVNADTTRSDASCARLSTPRR